MDTSDHVQNEVVDDDEKELFNTMQTDDSPLNNVDYNDPYERSPTWKSGHTNDDSASFVSSYHSSNH